MGGVEAQIDRQHLEEASHEQTRADEQQQRERHLHRHERVARARAAGRGALPAALAERLAELGA